MKIKGLYHVISGVWAATLSSIIGGWEIDPKIVRVVVPAIIISLGGGIIAAVVPPKREQKDWGWWYGVRSIVIAVIIGPVCALILNNKRWDWLGDDGKIALTFCAGLLGYQIVKILQRKGINIIADRLAKRSAD